MGASELSSSSIKIRLKREDCKRTKHDSAFSEWQILIGPSDWENYFLGKEGIERYRIHNLSQKCSCPGLYELGIASSRTNLGRDVRKLDQDQIIVVYLGQADNVRTRLQEYGRAGSHLDKGSSFVQLNADQIVVSQRGPGLFKEVFSRGFPIVFRWAPMENKKEAEKTEAQLLHIFDYAWNKGGNGVRRPNDILYKLDKATSGTTPFPNITTKLQQWLLEQPFIGKQSGIRIKPSSPTQSDTSSTRVNGDFRPRIFKFGRSQPRLVSEKCEVKEENAIICGVSLGDGSVCQKKPIQRRKRCEEHKGMRISTSTNIFPDKGRRNWSSNTSPEGKSVNEETRESTTICGVVLSDGSVCKARPIEGRKRCGEHKGQRVYGPMFTSKSEGESVICGVGLGDGTVCMKVPVHGRKRCESHKGRRVST